MGLLLLFGMPLVNSIYIVRSAAATSPCARIVAAICLLPPTLHDGRDAAGHRALGARRRRSGVSWLGFFYGGNIGGAVIGSLLAGFYLLRVYDMAIATYVAVALNVTVARLGLLLVARRRRTRPADGRPRRRRSARRARATVYVAIALSGFTALVGAGALDAPAVAAVRRDGLHVLADSRGVPGRPRHRQQRRRRRSRAARRARASRSAGARCCSAARSPGRRYMLTQSLPYWPINPSISTDPWFNFQLDMVRCLWVVLPGAILWGASFPLALASVAAPRAGSRRAWSAASTRPTPSARSSARVVSGLVLVVVARHASTSQQVLIVISALSALMLLAPVAAGESGKRPARSGARRSLLVVATARRGPARAQRAGAAAAARRLRPLLRDVGRPQQHHLRRRGPERVRRRVARLSSGVRNYHNAGKVQASSEPQDMRLQRMLGHLTHLIPKHADERARHRLRRRRDGRRGRDRSARRSTMTIAEIEPLVPRVGRRSTSASTTTTSSTTRRCTIHIDDARHFLLTTNEKFDAITSDPLDPWVKGAATLYTREFFELVKQHLNPGGVVTLFVQLYESNTAAVKSEIGDVLQGVPERRRLGQHEQRPGLRPRADGPGRADQDRRRRDGGASSQSPEYAQVAQSLREIGFNSAVDLFSTYAGTAVRSGAVARRTRRSTATATCGCSTWPAWA